MNEAGKGSGRRPAQVSKEVFEQNFDRIFGKKEEKDSCNQCGECSCDKKQEASDGKN